MLNTSVQSKEIYPPHQKKQIIIILKVYDNKNMRMLKGGESTNTKREEAFWGGFISFFLFLQ